MTTPEAIRLLTLARQLERDGTDTRGSIAALVKIMETKK